MRIRTLKFTKIIFTDLTRPLRGLMGVCNALSATEGHFYFGVTASLGMGPF